VHITAVQAAGLRGLNDGQAVTYEVAMERGKAAAINLKLAGAETPSTSRG
jgi:CspA family cold shock protein